MLKDVILDFNANEMNIFLYQNKSKIPLKKYNY